MNKIDYDLYQVIGIGNLNNHAAAQKQIWVPNLAQILPEPCFFGKRTALLLLLLA